MSQEPKAEIRVLDHGYVRLLDSMGDDLSPVNDAKVSFDKESKSFGEKEERLLGFLVREDHTSVFRHSVLKFEAYAPLMIARQWWKYAVASSHVEDQLGWNESSRRYVTEEPTFYVPGVEEWRSAPESRKQGSGPVLDRDDGVDWTIDLLDHIRKGVQLYESAMNAGIAAEQARLFLPAYAMYVRWRWTCSLGSCMHLLIQRLAHGSQKEFQLYASAVKDLAGTVFPVSIGEVLTKIEES